MMLALDDDDVIYVALARMAALFPTWAWKPDLILATEHLDPQTSHCKKNNLSSLTIVVSGEWHVWHVTYSSIEIQEKNKYELAIVGQ